MREARGPGAGLRAAFLTPNGELLSAGRTGPGRSRARELPEGSRTIRTTDSPEGLNEEIERRSRVVGIFPNGQAACLTLVTALAVETSGEWLTGRRDLDIEELKQERSRGRARAEAVFTKRR